ncbi:MAG TPA: four helix bundle protein [Gemmatimonadaceae bacterium]|nr:four helix bundle protein [Gemmatimonadaceae bacterium]
MSHSLMGDYRDLRVWHEARVLAKRVRKVAAGMKGGENAELRDQLTRAAMSVPTNIVEGSSHDSPREFARFLRYARASTSECEGHLVLASDFELVGEENFKSLSKSIEAVRKMLCGLIDKLDDSPPPDRRSRLQKKNGKRATGSGQRNSDDGESPSIKKVDDVP